jgi:L-ascorbate metabolism protein UlaG (beta-lactamase superfamily)
MKAVWLSLISSHLKKPWHAIGIAILITVGCAGPAVTIHYDDGAQVELISSKGTRVVVDLAWLDHLTAPMTKSDILLATHDSMDHLNRAFAPLFKGRKLLMAEGELSAADVHVLGIRSETKVVYLGAGHEKPIGYRGTMENFIYIIEMDGVRIAHFGDINQPEFTADQIAKIGNIDVAVMAFDVAWHEVNAQNKVGFKLMQQIRPSIIIPTHFSIEAAEYAKTLWPCFYASGKTIHLRKASKIPRKTSLLMMGDSNSSYAEIIHAAQWKD